MRCSFCGSSGPASQTFCRECGRIQSQYADSAECENHPGEAAVALCVLCGKPVCSDCAVTSDGRVYCNDPHHRALSLEWVPVYVADSEFESDMIACNLAAAKIDTRVFSFRKHFGAFWMSGTGLVRVLVPRQRRQDAIQLLHDLQLAQMEAGE